MDDEQRALILRARKGDQWAFEQLVTRYDRRILSMACDMVGDLDDARDIYQEALIAAYRGLPGFRLESDFSTWLYRIAVNQALKFRRRRSRGVQEVVPEMAPAGATSAEERMLDRELQAQVDLALETLSRQERMAFVLCHHQGLRIAVAADLMECSTGAVKSYLFRGREKLKKTLQPYMDT